jgi:APA family basic amino acid/polyamine antiporter
MQSKEDISDQTNLSLKRVVGLGSAIFLVAGNIIGTGVFKKIVPMAASGLSEKYILAVWLFAGIVTMLGAFSIAGLSKLTTEAGGMFEYLRLCFGNFVSFLFGWAYFTILGSGAIAAVGFVFSQSFNSLLPIPNPFGSLKNISFGFVRPFADSGIKILAIIVIALLTWLNYRGIKKGTRLNNIVTASKVLGILLLIVLGIFFSGSSNVANHASAPVKSLEGISFISVFFAMMLNAFWAYDGFANLPAVSSELKNTKRNIPIAIITGVSLVLLLYVLINYAFMRSMSLHQLTSIGENKVAAIVVAESILGRAGNVIISVLILLSTFGFLNVVIIMYSRYYYRMAQENVFFKKASLVHPVYRTPYYSLLYSMIWSCVLVISGSFDVLTDMVVFGSFVFHVLLAIGLIKKKRSGVIKEKIAAYPVAPVLFTVFISFVLVSTFIHNPVRTLSGIALILTGIPFYYFFKKRNLKNRATIKVNSDTVSNIEEIMK